MATETKPHVNVDVKPTDIDIEKEFAKTVEQKFQERIIEEAVTMRMIEHRLGDAAIDTDNPLNLEAGERATYIVNGVRVYPNGVPVKGKGAAERDKAVEEEAALVEN